jgi:hypothetical protein
MADPTPLNRNQIARFVGNDPDAIRAIERLFVVAGQLTPTDIATLTQLILDNSLALGAADNKAEAAMSSATEAERISALAVFDDAKAEVAMSHAVAAERLAALAATQPAAQDPRLDRLLDVQAPFSAAGMVLIYDATQRRWIADTITAGANITITSADGAITVATAGASGSFTAASLETVTVVDGIITSIV